jgi:rare lipoprotein A
LPLLKAIFGLVGVFVAISQAQASWIGRASYYWNPKFPGLFAAHRSLPFGTRLRVTNLGNGREVTVVVVERGPFVADRIIDVSTGAADALGFRGAGVAQVRLDLIDK